MGVQRSNALEASLLEWVFTGVVPLIPWMGVFYNSNSNEYIENIISLDSKVLRFAL